jgi:hypothetical protein
MLLFNYRHLHGNLLHTEHKSTIRRTVLSPDGLSANEFTKPALELIGSCHQCVERLNGFPNSGWTGRWYSIVIVWCQFWYLACCDGQSQQLSYCSWYPNQYISGMYLTRWYRYGRCGSNSSRINGVYNRTRILLHSGILEKMTFMPFD